MSNWLSIGLALAGVLMFLCAGFAYLSRSQDWRVWPQRAVSKWLSSWWQRALSNWLSIGLFVAAVSLLLLSAVFWNGNGNGAHCGQSESASNQLYEASFGGPYPIDGISPSKLTDFKRYKKDRLFASCATMLTSIGQFEESIKKGLAFPYAARRLKYNFVIDTAGSILVAEWEGNVDFKQLLSDKKCRGGQDFVFYKPEGMINWYPEIGKEDMWQWFVDYQVRHSPCWLEDDRTGGLLDALSKHFMLAQGKNAAISKFDKDLWSGTQVAYAGEILVDLKRCIYLVTNGSGTYRPEAANLSMVADHFEDVLGQGPAFYVKITNGGKNVSMEFRATKPGVLDPSLCL